MSDDIVIRVENLSKRYRISHLARQSTLRDAMHHSLRIIWRRLRWKTRLTREDFWALRNVNFEVKRGEVVGIIGRNGAGKSTLLKILSRITEPTAGRVTLRGRVASLLEVGTGFHPELTGRENIFLNGAILGMQRAEISRKFDEIVAFAEVERFIDTPVKRYSSGMYVRLAFAVAAHLEPEILIVDEVLAVGDAQFQAKCMGKMRRVSHEIGRTVLIVSHDLATIRQLCGQAIYLSDGHLRLSSSTHAVVSAYLADQQTASLDFEPISGSGVNLCDLRICCPRSTVPQKTLVFNSPYEIRLTIGGGEAGLRVTPFIRVHDSAGTLISSVCGPEEGLDFLPADTMHTYVCEIQRLPLMPGRYSMSVAVYSHASQAHLDAQQVFFFDVMPAMLNGATRAYRQDHGLTRLINGLRID